MVIDKQMETFGIKLLFSVLLIPDCRGEEVARYEVTAGQGEYTFTVCPNFRVYGTEVLCFITFEAQNKETRADIALQSISFRVTEISQNQERRTLHNSLQPYTLRLGTSHLEVTVDRKEYAYEVLAKFNCQ